MTTPKVPSLRFKRFQDDGDVSSFPRNQKVKCIHSAAGGLVVKEMPLYHIMKNHVSVLKYYVINVASDITDTSSAPKELAGT